MFWLRHLALYNVRHHMAKIANEFLAIASTKPRALKVRSLRADIGIGSQNYVITDLSCKKIPEATSRNTCSKYQLESYAARLPQVITIGSAVNSTFPVLT